ncbi:hypothetical protein ACTD5D_22505 [Nocardia takedensis]|uniref:hypothetical protein n=1 Tax=Nocardia takedensis TaxID=259390 RepID=UPI003F75895A
MAVAGAAVLSGVPVGFGQPLATLLGGTGVLTAGVLAFVTGQRSRAQARGAPPGRDVIAQVGSGVDHHSDYEFVTAHITARTVRVQRNPPPGPGHHPDGASAWL